MLAQVSARPWSKLVIAAVALASSSTDNGLECSTYVNWVMATSASRQLADVVVCMAR